MKMENNIIKFSVKKNENRVFVDKDKFNATLIKEERSGDEFTLTFDGPVTTIGNQAVCCGISGEDRLVSLELPDSVQSLTGHSFILPSPLNTSFKLMDDDGLIISDGVLMAAYLADEAVKITIPEGVHTIGPWAFPRKGSKKCEVIFPKSLRRIEEYAFYKCHFKVKFNKGLEYIGDHAFSYPKGPNLILPDSLKHIGERAFWDSEDIKKIKLNEGIEYIGRGAFGTNHGSVISIEGPYATENGLALIKDSVFLMAATDRSSLLKANSLATIVPEGVEIIDEGAIPNPIDVILPKTLKEIRKEAISQFTCSEFSIPQSVESIEDNAFCFCNISRFKGKFASEDGNYLIANNVLILASCDLNDSIDIPEGVERIAAASIKRKVITTLSIPASIRHIDKDAFGSIYNKTSINTIIVKAAAPFDWNMEALEMDATIVVPDSACEAFKNAYPDRAANIKKASEGVETVTISTEDADFYIQGKTLIQATSKSRNSELKIPDMIEEISDDIIWEGYAESSYDSTVESIKKIILPASLKRIGKNAFKHFVKVLSITLPKNLEEIGDEAFYGCGFGTVTIPDKVKRIGQGAFKNNERLKKVKIGKSVEFIGDEAFSECAKLETFEGKHTTPDKKMLIVDGTLICVAKGVGPDLVIPEGVTRLARECMKEYESISTLSIPEGITEILPDTIAGYRIDVLSLPDSLEHITKEAIKWIKVGAFKGKFAQDDIFLINGDCLIAVANKNHIDTIVIPETITVIGAECFDNLSAPSFNKLILPPNLKRIEDNALSSSQGEITPLPETLEYIGEKAFASIRESLFPDNKVVFPSNIKEVGNNAISVYGWGKTMEVWMNAVTPPVFGEKPLSDISKLHVPKESIEAYRAALPDFKGEIVE